jgi:ElaB/YqjD/DUF883 family membrane-anchored ribosome-binding protein
MAQRTDLVPQGQTAAGAVERTAKEIREDIAATRESISETVDRLGERLQKSLDWKEYVAEHPYVALGASAGLGFLISGLFKRRPGPRDRMVEALAETVEDFSDRVRDNLDQVLYRRRSTARALAGSALAVAANYIGRSLKSTISEVVAASQNQETIPSGAYPHPAAREVRGEADALTTRSSTAGSDRN